MLIIQVLTYHGINVLTRIFDKQSGYCYILCHLWLLNVLNKLKVK